MTSYSESMELKLTLADFCNQNMSKQPDKKEQTLAEFCCNMSKTEPNQLELTLAEFCCHNMPSKSSPKNCGK